MNKKDTTNNGLLELAQEAALFSDSFGITKKWLKDRWGIHIYRGFDAWIVDLEDPIPIDRKSHATFPTFAQAMGYAVEVANAEMDTSDKRSY